MTSGVNVVQNAQKKLKDSVLQLCAGTVAFVISKSLVIVAMSNATIVATATIGMTIAIRTLGENLGTFISLKDSMIGLLKMGISRFLSSFFYGDFMAKYLSYCEGCKLDCKDGLLDLNNSPHKVFSFDDYLVVDWWCAEHQALLHQKI